jgi:hypothetical protein
MPKKTSPGRRAWRGGIRSSRSQVTRSPDAELAVECLQERLARVLPDAHRAVAMHIAVAAHAAQPRAFAPDVTAEEEQVEHRLHVFDPIGVLRESEAPADDHPLDAIDDARRGLISQQGADHRASVQVGAVSPRRRTPTADLAAEPVPKPHKMVGSTRLPRVATEGASGTDVAESRGHDTQQTTTWDD